MTRTEKWSSCPTWAPMSSPVCSSSLTAWAPAGCCSCVTARRACTTRRRAGFSGRCSPGRWPFGRCGRHAHAGGASQGPAARGGRVHAARRGGSGFGTRQHRCRMRGVLCVRPQTMNECTVGPGLGFAGAPAPGPRATASAARATTSASCGRACRPGRELGHDGKVAPAMTKGVHHQICQFFISLGHRPKRLP